MSDWHPPHGYFSLEGQFDPQDISKRLEVEPNWSAKTGDINSETGLDREESCWCLACPRQEDRSIQSQITYLLLQLRLRADEISSLSAAFRGTLHLVACLDGNYAKFYLSAGTVIELASYNVSIDCSYVQVNRKVTAEPADAN